MEIEIITINEDPLKETKGFGIGLNKSLSNIKMVHWYSSRYERHIILGKLYDDLSDLFDKLQEEIIGTTNEYRVSFPMFESYFSNLDNISNTINENNEDCLDCYYETVNIIKNVLTSLEFNNFITTVKSGINNTKEDIITRINKANYLLSMVSL